jgi:hypothetical protein
MVERVIGGVMIVMGLIAAWVGMVVASRSLQSASRIYRRTSLLSAATLEGWGSWFLGGFSGMTMGIRWLYAVGAWLAWTLAGGGLIGLGIRLFSRL